MEGDIAGSGAIVDPMVLGPPLVCLRILPAEPWHLSGVEVKQAGPRWVDGIKASPEGEAVGTPRARPCGDGIRC